MALHVPVIIEPFGIVMVKAAVLPLTVPVTVIGTVPPNPGACIRPVNVSPDCVICQLTFAIVDDDIPEPIIDPLESNAVPVHVPLNTAAADAVAGFVIGPEFVA